MKRVLTAVVLIPIVLLIVFRAPMWVFSAFVGLVALLATHEYLAIAAAYCGKPLRWATLLSVLLIFLYSTSASWLPAMQATSRYFVLLLLLLAPFVFLALGMSRANLRDGAMAAVISYFALPYIAVSLWSLILLRHMSSFLVLFVLLVVWVGDTCAYYVGRSVGRHLLAPRISPKKTWEGTIASVVGSILVGVGVVHFAQMGSLGETAVIAVLVNVAAQIGDLVESLLKRGADIKDSGSILPGHGGILDRIDALLFAAPVATVLFAVTYRPFVHIFGM